MSNCFLWNWAQCSKDDAHSAPYYYCLQCDKMFCGDCWNKQKKHRKSDLGHDRTTPNDAIIFYSTLKFTLEGWPLLEDAIKPFLDQTMRQVDNSSEWFGVRPKNEAGDCSLVEGLAYGLMADSLLGSVSVTYPSLVSFVGETGSGKSTLISLLSKFSDPMSTNNFKTPAVGYSGSRQSTSLNVHLYIDPNAFSKESIILYAECEGLDGDEIPTEMNKSVAGAFASSDPLPHVSQTPELHSHNITWSKMPRNAGAWTRTEIARILFPRILYIFSDVVVFPFRRIQPDDTIFQLVKWGHSATIHSYNKPVLPRAIIVFINRDDQDDPREYDLIAARKSFFEQPCLQDVSKDKTLQPYMQLREANGQRIVSAEELLSDYYSSVSVVHLPSGQRPTIMHQQIDKLYDRISQACSQLQEQREAAWMKWDAVTFRLFVRKALTHFASKYETPFNFSDASVDAQQFSPNFNWSIFNLARMARGHRDLSCAGMDLWIRIGRFVASCLFLNCVRAKQADCRVTEKAWKQCDEAAEQYWMKFWPCDYTIQTPQGRQQCVNAPWGHPHHQCGKTVKLGAHLAMHSLWDLQNEFRSLVEKVFDELKSRLKHLSDNHKRFRSASEFHLDEARNFYKLIGAIDRPVSHLPCLVCLDGVPEHSLPCGHVICRECAKATGDSTPGRFVTLARCPIQNHREEDWPRGRTGLQFL